MTLARSRGVQRLLRQTRRRLDRSCREVACVLQAMEQGAALHLSYEAGRPVWRLSSGALVAAATAAIIVTKDVVVAVDDALFRNLPGQTWRYRRP